MPQYLSQILIDIWILKTFKECALLHFLCPWEAEIAPSACFSFCFATNTNITMAIFILIITWSGVGGCFRERCNTILKECALLHFCVPGKLILPQAAVSVSAAVPLTIMTILIIIIMWGVSDILRKILQFLQCLVECQVFKLFS